MIDKEVVSLDEYLNSNKTKKNNNKRFVISLTALLVAMTIGITALLSSVGKRNNKNNNNSNNSNTPSSSLTLNDLGADLGYDINNNDNDNKNTYSNPTGSVVVENVVKDKDGKIYANKDALDKSSNIGTTTDTQNGKLEVKDDGKVFEKNDGYEINTSSGVITGEITEDNKVNDYVWDSVLGTYVKPEDLGKYVKDETGKLWLKTDYEEYLKLQGKENTSIPEKTEEKIEVENVIEGVLNEDGTYTIGTGNDSITFISKADFDQWIIQGFTGYGIDVKTGMMVPDNQISSSYQKVK